VSRTGRLLALAFLLLAVAPAAALAAHHKKTTPPAVAQVYADCKKHNSLQGHYSLAILEQALADMKTDVKEYSICADEIQNAENKLVGGSHPLPRVSPAERHRIAKNAATSLKQAKQQGGAPLNLGGQRIAAGAVGLRGSSFLADLPTPILVLLAVLLALGSVPVALRAQAFVRARRSR
jgi:hypothetical protein